MYSAMAMLLIWRMVGQTITKERKKEADEEEVKKEEIMGCVRLMV